MNSGMPSNDGGFRMTSKDCPEVRLLSSMTSMSEMTHQVRSTVSAGRGARADRWHGRVPPHRANHPGVLQPPQCATTFPDLHWFHPNPHTLWFNPNVVGWDGDSKTAIEGAELGIFGLDIPPPRGRGGQAGQRSALLWGPAMGPRSPFPAADPPSDSQEELPKAGHPPPPPLSPPDPPT